MNDPVRTQLIADLNDLLRLTFGTNPKHGRVLITSGIEALSQDQRGHILVMVRHFDDFTHDNDPHLEHDFGKVIYDGIECFWKIDYYAKDLQSGSPDPADAAVTERVLTIMLTNEY